MVCMQEIESMGKRWSKSHEYAPETETNHLVEMLQPQAMELIMSDCGRDCIHTHPQLTLPVHCDKTHKSNTTTLFLHTHLFIYLFF